MNNDVFITARTRITGTGWSVTIIPGYPAWKVRKEASKLMYYPRQKYAAAQAQFEQAGWTVIQNAARYLWKLRKDEWHIIYYPKTEKMRDSLNNIRMTGLQLILRYLKTLKQPDGKLQPCMRCRYFQPGSIHRRDSQCEKNRKIRKINKEYFGICDDFKGR